MKKAFLVFMGLFSVWAPRGTALAESASTVYYHDQSVGFVTSVTFSKAMSLASSRLGFSLRKPSVWPKGSSAQAVWVMERQKPGFALMYFSSPTQYISCQLRESVGGSTIAALHWAPSKSVLVGSASATLLQTGDGPGTISEIIWTSHGIHYDLLGSTVTSQKFLLKMAASL